MVDLNEARFTDSLLLYYYYAVSMQNMFTRNSF